MTWDLPGAAPLFATPRTPGLRSDGAQIEVIGQHLGTPLIPWQRYVSEVAGERRPDGSFQHQIVVVSVPRQTGKTTLIRATGVHRCLVCRRDVFYTAQTGKDARERWMDLVKILRVDPALGDRIQVALRGGSEAVTFPGGAAFRVFAPTPESLHGYTPPTVMADEVFALTAMAGELLMGAIGPAQITVPDRQVWLVSTAGTAESVFLHEWITRAMEHTPRVAGFIWGARDDQDPYDLADIEAFHPGVGFTLGGKTLTAADVLANADTVSRAEYERAFANRRTRTTANLIDRDTIHALAGAPEPPASTSEIVLAYDVAPNRMAAAIIAAWLDPAGLPQVKVVRAEAGSAWLATELDDLATRWRPRALAAVGSGPVVDTTLELTRAGHEVTELTERTYAAATNRALALLDGRGFIHDGTDRLEEAFTGLVTRTAGADGVAFSRRHSVGDTSPAIATVAGLHVLADNPTVTPLIYFPEGA